ncbi:MAG: TrbC/VirB2 family protein [Candidatus Midichloriaceae bacterium]
MKRAYISMFIFLSLFLTITFFNVKVSMADDPAPGAKDIADPGSQIADVLCNVIKIAQGNVGKTISILVIISIAIGLFLGKITWGVAIAVSVGLGVLFGANSVVEFIASGKGGVGPCPKNN